MKRLLLGCLVASGSCFTTRFCSSCGSARKGGLTRKGCVASVSRLCNFRSFSGGGDGVLAADLCCGRSFSGDDSLRLHLTCGFGGGSCDTGHMSCCSRRRISTGALCGGGHRSKDFGVSCSGRCTGGDSLVTKDRDALVVSSVGGTVNRGPLFGRRDGGRCICMNCNNSFGRLHCGTSVKVRNV